MAALMNNSGTIVAVDRRGESLNRLREETRRLGAVIVETRTADAVALPDPLRDSFDRVLLDAPCSGLGTLRRNPEIRWRLSPKDFRETMEVQKRLLRSAAAAIRPGGRLVYSVCTISPEENELVVGDLLKSRPDFAPVLPPADNLPPGSIDERGFLHTFPHRHGLDGFFAAVLTRKT
jgi:16S rRNA (cytosine967-C5)-methyltransferase